MAYKGKYKIKNREKYMGNPDNVIYRSLWERKVMKMLDDEPGILKWASEEVVIPYKCPTTGKHRRYFPDFVFEMLREDGQIVTMMIEVKPKKHTTPPVKPAKNSPKYIREVYNYGINSSKWEAARKYCKQRGWEFAIWTEDDLNIKYKRKKKKK